MKKIHQIWVYSAKVSAACGMTVDPRILMAILISEGTGSFDTNPDVSAGKCMPKN